MPIGSIADQESILCAAWLARRLGRVTESGNLREPIGEACTQCTPVKGYTVFQGFSGMPDSLSSLQHREDSRKPRPKGRPFEKPALLTWGACMLYLLYAGRFKLGGTHQLLCLHAGPL